jgi:CubicO group peptidase (beta-lactamase class C family)
VRALELVKTWPVATASVAVVDRSGVVASLGPDVVLPWASITKLVTALTVLAAVKGGDLSLDTEAGPPGSTVRHLLAHASGIAPADDTVLTQPGRRRIYSNRGYELVADLTAERAGVPFAEQLAASVLAPLGMADCELAGSPAAGLRGSLTSLALLGKELLAPSLVPELMTEATSPVFPGLPGVLPGYGRQAPNDWGLGFEIRGGKQPHWTGQRNSPQTFGHFGQTGTFLWVDPVAGLACACLTDRDFGDWASVWPELSDAVLAEFSPRVSDS